MATRDSEFEANGASGVAVKAHADGTHLTVFLYSEAASEMLRNLETHPEMAVLCERPTDHRACQMKGVFESSRQARRPERAEIDRQFEGFLAELEGIGIPRVLSRNFKTWPAMAIQMRVTQLFEQTPGPGAGEPMR